MEKQVLEIQFRKLKEDGSIIAVFPYEIENQFNVTCYQHLGQHSSASWDINMFTKFATPLEYSDLLKELQGIYSDTHVLKVITKRIHSKYLKAYNASIKKRG